MSRDGARGRVINMATGQPVVPSDEQRRQVALRQVLHELPYHRSRRLHGLLYGSELEQQGYDQKYGSASEADADLALLFALVLDDAALIEQLMYVSTRSERGKWTQHKTYVARTVAWALDQAKRERRRLLGEAEDTEPASRWSLLTDQELLAIEEPDWLLKGALFTGGFTVLYGESDTYKSFVALDWAFAIGQGQPWLELPTKQALVVYIVAEGSGWFGRRVAAARAKWDVTGADSGVRFVTVPVNLFQEREVAAFMDAVADQLGEDAERVGLFVADTWARNMVGAKENDATDTGVGIEHCRRLQSEFNAAVMVIHHTGHDGKDTRGSYAMIGAADCKIKVSRVAGLRTVQLVFEKVKDWEPPAPIRLQLVKREQSLVVAPADPEAAPVSKPTLADQLRQAVGQAERTAKEIAGILKVDPTTVRKWLKDHAGLDKALHCVGGGDSPKDPARYACNPNWDQARADLKAA